MSAGDGPCVVVGPARHPPVVPVRALDDRELGLLRRAQADAELIGRIHFAMMPTTAASCWEHGLSLRRWHWARALLRRAGVHDGRRVSVFTAAEFAEGLRLAVREVEAGGLHLLTNYLVRGVRRE